MARRRPGWRWAEDLRAVRFDGSVAVVLLDHLFLAGLTPGCQAACDANASGGLTVSDVIAFLRHPFLGGPWSPPYSLGTAGPPSDPQGECETCGAVGEADA